MPFAGLLGTFSTGLGRVMAVVFASLGPREEPSIFTTKTELAVWLCGVKASICSWLRVF